MNEKNILSLKARLIQLGFEPSVDTLLRCNICFTPQAFDLVLIKQSGSDSFQFSVHLQKANDQYELQYYTATLRKQVVISADMETLSDSMQSVDWDLLTTGKLSPVKIDSETIETAFSILGKLQSAGPSAEVLKYKYWTGTALEPMIGQLTVLKNEWEISERFYFFDDNMIITFAEAGRFLSSRWMEKQMTAKKKLLFKKTEGDRSSGSVAGGKLLGKNPRRHGRRVVNKAS